MKTELFYLTCVTALTGLLWVPYILDRVLVRGVISAMGYPVNPEPQTAWAQRMMKAHGNAVENLVVFATLILVANAAGITNEAIATASVVYFWARVVHAVTFTFGIPWIRTFAFVAGVGAQAVVAWQILVH